jgi:DNA-binding NarL/FixJ family response regulator
MIRVAVVDDHPVFRQGIAHAIEAEASFELVAAVAAVEDLTFDPPIDVVVLDLGLPGLSGAAAVTHVREHGAKVLVVSADGERRQVVDAISAGAGGYLTKTAEPREITEATAIVSAGGTYVSPTLASYLIAMSRGGKGDEGFKLTIREREILALVAAGERDTDIAEELFISIRTVQSHLDRIRDKTGYRRRPDLTRLAIKEGLVDDADR